MSLSNGARVPRGAPIARTDDDALPPDDEVTVDRLVTTPRLHAQERPTVRMERIDPRLMALARGGPSSSPAPVVAGKPALAKATVRFSEELVAAAARSTDGPERVASESGERTIALEEVPTLALEEVPPSLEDPFGGLIPIYDEDDQREIDLLIDESLAALERASR